MRFAWLWTLCLTAVTAQGAIDVKEAEKKLATTGLPGLMHAAAHDFDQYVFQIRDPESFFASLEFSVVTESPRVKAVLKTLRRHDEVLAFGRLVPNPSPQKHLLLTDIKVVKRYRASDSPSWPKGLTIPEHHREAKLPEDLLAGNTLVALVHAVPAEGGVVVLEYKDAIVPLFVRDNRFTRKLIRGDKVRAHYKVLRYPKKPTHLMLDESVAEPIATLKPEPADGATPAREDGALGPQDGKTMTLEGALVFYPKSPQISIEVFALQTVDRDGLKRIYNILSFDSELFAKLYVRLTDVWRRHWSTAVDGRNLYVNPKIRVRVTGEVHVAANPQIEPKRFEDVEILP